MKSMGKNIKFAIPKPPSWGLKVIRVIDIMGEWSGKIFSWLVLPMTFCIVYEVISRYFFHRPTMWAHDVTWMLYGTHFMLGAAYTLYKKGHIRTDLLYANWSLRTRKLVDIIGYLFFFFPGMAFFFIVSLDRAILSWSILEVSGLTPWRPPVYPVITVMPVSIALVLLQGVSEVIKCVYSLFYIKGEWS